MRFEFLLPQSGMGMSEGTISRWYVAVGEPVQQGDALVDIETEKVELALDAPVSGSLAEILVGDGETVDVGTVLALIETAD